MRHRSKQAWRTALALAALSRPVSAADAPASPSASAAVDDALPPRVELVLVGDAPGGSALLERSSSWFRDPGVTVEAARAPALAAGTVFATSRNAGVRIWIWLRTPSAARVFVTAQEPARGAARYWVTDVALRSGLDELGTEELAQLVHLSALAVWSGNLESGRSEVEAGLALPAPRPTDRAPAPVHEQPRTRTFTLGAEYSLRFAGDEGAPQAFSAVAGLGFRRAEHELAARLHAGVFIPRRVQNAQLELSLNGGSAWLEGVSAWRLSERSWLTASAGPGADIVRYSARSTETLRAEPGSTDFRPFLQAAAGLRVELGSVSVSAAALVLVQWLRVHYDVARPAAQDEVVTPWLVQPGGALGVTW